MSETLIRSPQIETAPGSPVPRRAQRPSWFDIRLVLGVVLVLSAVVAGAFVMSANDQRKPVWVVDHDMAAGTILHNSDLRSAQVQLGSSQSKYVPVTDSVEGNTVQHQLRAGQLLPRSELGKAHEGIVLSVPVQVDNSPVVDSGDLITLWLTSKDCAASVVFSGVVVQSVRTASGSALSSDNTIGVIVTLSESQALRTVAAMGTPDGELRIGLLSPGDKASSDAGDSSTCKKPKS